MKIVFSSLALLAAVMFGSVALADTGDAVFKQMLNVDQSVGTVAVDTVSAPIVAEAGTLDLEIYASRYAGSAGYAGQLLETVAVEYQREAECLYHNHLTGAEVAPAFIAGNV